MLQRRDECGGEGGRRREEHWADGMMIGSNSGFSKSAEKRVGVAEDRHFITKTQYYKNR